jgi:hypothetical protein
MSRTGSSSRKLPARTYSTSWHSAGEALSTDTARGRLLPAATAMIFVPLPRRVGPTAKPPFWRSRKWHRRTPHPDSAFPAGADAEPEASAPVSTCHCAPTAETCDDRSGREDTSPAAHATAPRCPTPRAHHSAQSAYRATDGHVHQPAALAAAPAQPWPIVHRSVPSVLSRRLAVIPEQHQDHMKSPLNYL